MKKEYDFSNAVRNPYIDKNLKKQVSMNLSIKVVDYFKELSAKKGVPYQTLINLFLNDCVDKKLDVGIK